MEIPARSHPAWKALVMGEKTCNFEFFGLQMLLKRLTMKVKLKAAPDTVDHCIDELRAMFVENYKIPKVQRDLEKIFGQGGGV